MFFHEYSDVARRVQAKEKIQAKEQSHMLFDRQMQSSISPRLLPIDIKDAATNFYFENFTHLGRPEGLGSYLPKLYNRGGPDTVFKNAVIAVGMAGLANIAKNPIMRQAARQQYVAAISKVNEALSRPSRPTEDGVVMSVMMLSMFETMTCCHIKSRETWIEHIKGAVSLIALRGENQFHNETGRSIFLYMRSNIISSCLQREVVVPELLCHWSMKAQVDDSIDRRKGNELMNIVTRFANLRALLKDGLLTDASDIVLTALAIEQDLIIWLEDLSPAFIFTTTSVETATEMTYGSHCHIYEHLWAAFNINTYRTTHLMIHSMILECLVPYATSTHPVGMIQNPASQYQKSLEASHYLGAEIAAGLPFHLGFSKSSGMPPPHKRTPIAGGLFSLWPLYILGSTSSIPEDLRAWSAERLIMIGKTMGIQTASMLAWVVGMTMGTHP
ncbi:hypothetical protein V500_03911 [Pseudogymnoascus sp. VKM F-4518 (FW-2643)]|nr:hypothetical protein V500_03911 [Pseudogymnoascus sp. VKM F-4518 (FW-2643)]